ncbi:unnamed protein product [Pleuronectes platessa]|uniref:Uncharacterized protein n=1 Tax=Pleuronectes platessa TaxID=8262 RepID=A0A9N7YD39_PLEPL|nr:unnamed protein product [Pleuronectes platessa]
MRRLRIALSEQGSRCEAQSSEDTRRLRRVDAASKVLLQSQSNEPPDETGRPWLFIFRCGPIDVEVALCESRRPGAPPPTEPRVGQTKARRKVEPMMGING